MSNWYYSKDGGQKGPVSEAELSAKKASGELVGTDLVWKEGMPDWLPLEQVAEFSNEGSLVTQGPASGVPLEQPPAYTAEQASQVKKIPTYLWQAIAVTLLCCLPFGVVAIVYAAKVDGLVARGDIAGAEAASKSAKLWVNVSVIVSLAIMVISFLLSSIESSGSSM